VRVARWREGQAHGVDAQPGACFRLRAISPRCSRPILRTCHCIHAESAGCYGHNGADAWRRRALVARANGRPPVKLQWMRDDDSVGAVRSAMVMKLSVDSTRRATSSADARRVDPSAQQPSRRGGRVNLLASWHWRNPPARRSRSTAAADRRRDATRSPLYDFRTRRWSSTPAGDAAPPPRAAHAAGYATCRARNRLSTSLQLRQRRSVEFRLRHLKDPRARA